jgi:hypothetical protein
MTPESRIVEPKEATTARQRPGKHVAVATNTHAKNYVGSGTDNKAISYAFFYFLKIRKVD